MPAQPVKPVKATLLKLFIINDDGEYAGEYAVDEDCTVEFDDCLKVMGNHPVEDMQTLLLGDLRMTMLAGNSFNLLAVSKGPLGKQELTWAKATLTTTEAVFTRVLEEREPQPAKDSGLESELKTVKGKLSDVESRLEVERSKAEQEARSLKEQVTQLQSKASHADEMQKQLAAAANREQQLRREMASKQESMSGIQQTIAQAMQREESIRRQFDSIRAENENLKSMAASIEETKRQIAERMELLSRKAMELLEREERLKDKEQGMRAIPVRGIAYP